MDDYRVSTELGGLQVRVVGEGPPVALWHSMFVDSCSWDRLVPLLPDRTLHLIDAPSCGASDALTAPSDISACAVAAGRVAEEICDRHGVGALDWVGNAWGGHVGMELAATRPELIASLVSMSAPTFPIDSALRRRIRLLLPLYRCIGPRGPVRSAILDAIVTDRTRAQDPEVVEILDEALRRSGPAMIPAIQTAILRRTDLEWAARQITCPVLFIATDDRGEWTSDEAEAVARTMTDCRVQTVTGARVIPALEQPDATASAIREFWSEVAVRTGDA